MRRVVAGVLVVGALLVAGAAVRADDQPRALEDFAILGLEDVTLRTGVEVESGNVGATRDTVELGRRVRVAGAVLASTIELGRGSRVGPLFCRFVQGPVRFGCTALAEPVANLAHLSFVQVQPGAADVTVPPRASSAPLPAGAYGALSVGARGRLFLDGGSFDVLSLEVARRGSVICTGRCRLRVRERVKLGRRATLGVASPQDARVFEVDLEARAPRPVFATAPDTTIAATIYAPNGDIALGARGRYEGAFVAQTVTVGKRARVKLLSAF